MVLDRRNVSFFFLTILASSERAPSSVFTDLKIRKNPHESIIKFIESWFIFQHIAVTEILRNNVIWNDSEHIVCFWNIWKTPAFFLVECFHFLIVKNQCLNHNILLLPMIETIETPDYYYCYYYWNNWNCIQ